MSIYATIFIRYNNEFAPVGDFIRNSEFFHFFELIGVPYGKVKGITTSDCESMEKMIEEKIQQSKNYIADKENRKDLIAKINRPIEEILEAIDECQYEIEKAKNKIDELRYVLHYVEIMKDQTYTVFEEVERSCDSNCLYYVGIEVDRPTVNDLKE